MALLLLAGWALLAVLTVGPIFSAQAREGDEGWFWIGAALLLGPLAGIGYYTSRHAMRKVDEAQYKQGCPTGMARQPCDCLHLV